MGISSKIAGVAKSVLGLIKEVKIGNLTVSALTGLDKTDELNVTRKPIELGYAITDAAVDVPTDLTLDICLADPDLSAGAAIGAALKGDIGSLKEKWKDKENKLYQMFNARELIIVQTHEGEYPNMLIQSIAPWWDVTENAAAFFATVSFLHINQIENFTIGGLLDKAKEVVSDV